MTIHEAKDFNSDKVDPYVWTGYNRDTFKSETIKDCSNPRWDFTVTYNLNSQKQSKINIEVFDENIGRDTLLGKVELSQQEILQTMKEDKKWIPLQKSKHGQNLVSFEIVSHNQSNNANKKRQLCH